MAPKPKWTTYVADGVMMRRNERGDVERLYVIVWNATRSILWGSTRDDAFLRWTGDYFTVSGQTRLMPPLQSEVIVRYADAEEQTHFGKRRTRRRTRPDALFDARTVPTKYDSPRIGAEGTVPTRGAGSRSKSRNPSLGSAPPDPVLERRLRDGGR